MWRRNWLNISLFGLAVAVGVFQSGIRAANPNRRLKQSHRAASSQTQRFPTM